MEHAFAARPAVSGALLGLALVACLAGAPARAWVSTPAAGTANTASTDGIALASAHAGAVREASSPEAWGGMRTGRESTLADRVVDYTIDARLDPVAHVVDGQEKLTWRNRSRLEVRSVYLHLYLNAFEGEHSTFLSENRNLGFQFRSDVPARDGQWGHIELVRVEQGAAAVPWQFVHPDGGPETDHTVVRLDLPRPVGPGQSTTLDIAFKDQLPRVVARTGYFGTFHLVGQWFPKIGVLELPGERGAHQVQWNVHEFHLHSEFYADYGSFDVRITVPREFTVGATGEETEPPVLNGALATHHFMQGDVHDFAWTADSRSAPPLEGEYRGAGSPVVKVKVLYPPEYEASAAPTLKATLDSLEYFSRTLGPYPYRTVTVVLPPFNAEEAGGMEYPTFFTSEGARKVEPGTYTVAFIDFVTIHEFGHGYFYGILGSNEFEEPMLDEGLNEYWDFRMMRERNQVLYAGGHLSRLLGITPTVSAFDFARLGAMRSEPSDKLGANSWDRMSSGGYVSVYDRTALTMHGLEEAVGKEAMERAFKEYYRRWKFRHPAIADLRETLAEVTGQRALVEASFEQQVYATSKVDDAVEVFNSTEELPRPGTHPADGRWVERTTKEIDKEVDAAHEAWAKAHPDAKEGTGGPYPWRTTLILRHRGVINRQEAVVHFADGSTESVTWDSPERWQRFSWVKPVRAVSVEIDPQGHSLLDANILDNSRTIEPDPSAARRTAGDFAAIVQLLFSLLAAL